jgi:O-antigen/teichoic acid export membrane protein
MPRKFWHSRDFENFVHGNLFLSAILFVSSTGVSLIVAIVVIISFGWENYGSLITVLTFSFVLNQIATGGSQNQIIRINANSPRSNLKVLYRVAIRKKRSSNVLVSFLIFSFLSMHLLNFVELKSLDTTLLVIILLSSFISPNLRIRLSLFVSNERFKTYFFSSLARNLIFLLLVIISTSVHSKEMVYASFLIADAIMALAFSIAFRAIPTRSAGEQVPFEISSTLQFTFINLYHEILPKVDLFCLIFLSDPSLIGKYSILVLLSEGMHSLYGVIRTQNTPKFSNFGVVDTKSLFIHVKAYIFTSLVILSLGVVLILMLMSMNLIVLDNGLGVLILLSLNSMILLFPIIYTSVLTQWHAQMLQVRLYFRHLMSSLIVFVLGYEIHGLTLALVLLCLVNSAFAIKVYYSLIDANPYRAKL